MDKPGSERSDEELMTLYKGGDYTAFECLYRRHSGRIFQYIKAKVPNEVAKELLQETFLKIHRSRHQYVSQYPFLPWIFTIARNALTDFFKRSESRIVSIGVEPDLLAADGFPNAPENDLSAALATLPNIQRKAIELRYMNEWSFEKMAEEMKTTPENSRQILSRGIKKMRSFLQRGKK